ncbi:MAG: FAD-dependent oxidoreductase [Spirochaetia bacterium]
MSKETKVAIIGAGTAGLSAACYLQDKGYENITLFERENHAGGKCRTLTFDGKTYELGAVLGTCYYDKTLDLMQRAGLKPCNFDEESDCSQWKEMKKYGYFALDRTCPDYIRPIDIPGLLIQVAKYKALSKKYENLYKPGFHNIPEELYEPFGTWMKKNKMELFGKMIQIPFTTFGYGYYDEIPAAYVLKYIDYPTATCLIRTAKFFKWDEGVQEIWNRLADKFDTRLGASITSITRDDEKVRITADGSTEEFDKLIITSPLDELPGVMDTSQTEEELFSKIQYYDYRVFLCRAEDFPLDTGFVPSTFTRGGAGHMMIWDRRWKTNDIFTIYVLNPDGLSDEELEKNLEKDMVQAGGKLKEILHHAKWKYFPHVTPEDFQNGFYAELEGLQGRKNTYYAGEITGFSTIEISAAYSEELVDKHF